MVRDITLGQHFPGDSRVHRLDPRLKLLLVVAYIVVLFVAPNLAGLALSAAFLAGLYALAKIPVKMVLRSMKPILPIILFTGIINLFFVQGDIVFHWWIFTVTKQGLYFSLVMVVRIVCLIAATSLLTYTTSPIALTDALERVMSPLKLLHAPVHEVAMMMTIALRFIPTLVEETDKIMNAQKARGAELDTGKLTDRIKALIPVLIPLFISAFRRADELAMAMECRCYHGGEGRTRLKTLEITSQDILSTAVCLLFLAAVVSTNFFVPKVI